MALRTIIIRSNQVAPDSRVEKEAATLAESGYSVKIIAWDRQSNHAEKTEEIEAFNQRIPIVRFGHKANFGDGFKSLKPYIKFQWNIFRWLIINRNEYDVIHACDFDTAWVSTLANILLRKKYIFDIFDYIGGERVTARQKILCRIQNAIINRSDATVICTEKRKKQIFPSNPKRLAVIHNSPPETIFHDNSISSHYPIKICYVGILQDFRLLKEIPDFFIKHTNYELHIGGFGKYEALFEKLSAKYKNIKYYGRLQYEETLELEHKCDIMLAIYDPAIENHIFAAPNKFYEGLMLGKPLVMVKGTGMSEIVEEYHIGETIDYSYEGFESGILNLTNRMSEWPDIHINMKQVYKQYSWDLMKKRLLELYKTI